MFLVGSTGSGKSTIMRLLIKEIEPTYGTIHVAGRELGSISRSRIPYYRRNLGVVFQDFKLLPNRTVYDNVAYALQVTGGTRREVRDKVPDILRLTGLSTKLHSYPDQLSGGEQQRVSVARAFVNHPPLLLADEPTGNLDPETSVGIMQLLYRINRTGTTVVVATHDNAMVDRMRRRVIEVSRGTIVRDERAGRYAGTETHARVRGAAARRGRAHAAVPLARRRGARRGGAGARGVRFGFFLREALRALRRNAIPSFAAMATVLVTVLVLGVFIPVVQATTSGANEIRAKVVADVYLTPEATERDIERVRAIIANETPGVARVQFISKEQAYAEERKRNPEAYDLLGTNPLPDTFRITPTTPDDIGKVRDALAPVSPVRRAHGGRPRRSTRCATSEEDTEKILSATRVVKLTMAPARRPARPRVAPAGGQHDPALALRAPARGRGDEAGRRDGLVHPLAVRDRGDARRRARRRARRAAPRRGQDRARRSAGGGLRAHRRAGDDELPAAHRRAARAPRSASRRSGRASRCAVSCASRGAD